MKRTRKANGKCVYTTAEHLGEVDAPDVRLDTPFNLVDLYGSPRMHWGNSPAILAKQNGNGSIRLVYPIPKYAGGGSFKPFVFPAPYKPHKSYPLDERGVDPRDVAEVEANRRYFGL
jgi:hypothetical protein